MEPRFWEPATFTAAADRVDRIQSASLGMKIFPLCDRWSLAFTSADLVLSIVICHESQERYVTARKHSMIKLWLKQKRI